MQANAIANGKARELLTSMGFGVIGREEEVRSDAMTGHLDIRAYHRDKGEAIIDLKTGQGTGTAWLQVGGYLDLFLNYAPMPAYAGVLHVPRQRIDRDQKGTLELREAKPVQQAWRQSVAAHSGRAGRRAAHVLSLACTAAAAKSNPAL